LAAGTSFGRGRGAFAPLNLKIVIFCVFAHTIYLFSNFVSPLPLGSGVKIVPSLEKTEMTSLPKTGVDPQDRLPLKVLLNPNI